MRPSNVVLMTVLALVLLGATPVPAGQSRQDLVPVRGDDPVETALAYSALVDDGGGNRALVATAATFADSLASGLLQGQWDAPLLLTQGQELDERVITELDRLGTEQVTILGGVDSIEPVVEEQLAEIVSEVDRISGDTRITTALAVADAVYEELGTDSVILARAFGTDDGDESRAFADAMAAGSAAATRAYPVILTPTGGLDPQVAKWMVERGTRRVIIAGGTAAISQAVEDQLTEIGIDQIVRAGGSDRVSTAVLISGYTAAVGPQVVVQGEGELAWASGFAAALHSPGGVFLAAGDTVPGMTLAQVLGRGGDPGVLCGAALHEEQCRLVTAASIVKVLEDPYEALMDGEQVVEPVETTNSATAALWIAGDDAMCLQIERHQGPGVTTAALYQGDYGEIGTLVIEFDAGRGDTSCTLDVEQELIQAIVDEPDDFYLQFGTRAHPEGELRGQIHLPPEQAYIRIQSGPDDVVPGPGEPEARAFTLVIPTGVEDELCVYTDIEVLSEPPTTIHIHEGAPGETGEVVFTLDEGTPSGRSVHCDRGVDADRLANLFTNPTSYYMDVHTETYPDGAIRGNAVIDHTTTDGH